MQKIFLQGRLVSDAAVRQYNGRSFLSFTLACNERVKGEEVPSYYNVTWNNYADGLVQYLTKGKALSVVGNVRFGVETSQKDGKVYPRADVRADSVDFVNLGGSGSTTTVTESAASVAAAPAPVAATMPAPAATAAPVYATAPQPVAQPAPSVYSAPAADDDLPF